MAGYQFIHIEAYGRKASGKGSGTVGYVLDEAERRPDAVPHVEHPAPPELLHGMPLADLRQTHEVRCGEARQLVAGGKERAIRQDQKTLMTAVLSYPVARADLDTNSTDDLREWELRSVAWLRDRYGENLASVVRHTDEAFPHLHAYILPSDPGMRASALHPGLEAKNRLMATLPVAETKDQNKARNREGDRAYREAMRDFQQDYWTKVGLPCGLARMGPGGRRRLSRSAWQDEKRAGDAVLTARRAATRLEARNERLKAQGDLYVRQTKEEVAKEIAAAEALRLEAEADRTEAARLKQLSIHKGRKTIESAKVQGETIVSEANAKAKDLLAAAEAEAEERLAPTRTIGRLVAATFGTIKSVISDDQAALDARRAEIETEGEAKIAKAREDERRIYEMESEARQNAQAEAARERKARETVERKLDGTTRDLETTRGRLATVERALEAVSPSRRPQTPSGASSVVPTLKPR